MSVTIGLPCVTCGRLKQQTRPRADGSLECGRCRQNTIARQRRAAAKRAERIRSKYEETRPGYVLALEGMHIARRNGHDMAPLERDTTVMRHAHSKQRSYQGYISYCLECGRYMVVDIEESDRPYGDTQTGQRCGSFKPRPAPRRSEYQLDYAVATAGLEPQGLAE